MFTKSTFTVSKDHFNFFRLMALMVIYIYSHTSHFTNTLNVYMYYLYTLKTNLIHIFFLASRHVSTSTTAPPTTIPTTKPTAKSSPWKLSGNGIIIFIWGAMSNGAQITLVDYVDNEPSPTCYIFHHVY